MALNDRDYQFLRNLGTAYLEVEPINGLTFKGTFSVDWFYQRRMTWSDVNSELFSYAPRDPLSFGIPGEDDTIGSYGERHTRNTNLVMEFAANYTKSFGKHNLDLLFNYMDQQYMWEAIHGGADQIPSRVEDFIPMNYCEREYNSIENDKDHYALQGILGRVGYNYDNRYYLDGTIRRDGTSRFHPDNRWGTFPSVSAAWRISSEPFMENLDWLTDLKIRGGWGQLGNQETQSFAYLSLINRNPTYAFGSTLALNQATDIPSEGIFSWGAALPTYPNIDLSWEKTSTTNIGFDANLLMRIDISVEYYYKFTDGILQSTNLPASVGAQNPPVANIASISNQGIEASVGYNNNIGDFNYSVNANLTTVKNEVLSLYDDAPLGGSLDRIEIGYPLHYIWGYEMGGIFRDQAEVDAYQESTTDNLAARQEPGDIWFEDVNGPPDPDAEEPQFYTEGADSIVNSYDRTYLGKTIPGFFYGVSINLEWKGIDLSAFFQGVGDVQRNWQQHATSMTGLGNNWSTDVLDRWTPTNTDADIPRAVAGDPADNNRFSSRTIYDAGFFRFANLQLGYTVPPDLSRRLGIFQMLRVWVGGSNLFVISPYPGLDPENDVVPPPRVFNVGVDMRF